MGEALIPGEVLQMVAKSYHAKQAMLRRTVMVVCRLRGVDAMLHKHDDNEVRWPGRQLCSHV